MRTAYIYALVASNNTTHYKYIGVTVNLKKRLTDHINDTYKAKAYDVNKHKINWQRKVLSKGHKIEMIVLAEFESEDSAFSSEDNFIEDHKTKGHQLTNKATGGRGGILFSDPEELQAFYERRTEVFRKPETREIFRQASLKKWNDPEYRERTIKAIQKSLTVEVRRRIDESNRKQAQERIARGESLDPVMLAERGRKLSIAGKKYFEDPANREKNAEATKKMWASQSEVQKASRAYKAKMTRRYNKANKNGWVFELTPVTKKECV